MQIDEVITWLEKIWDGDEKAARDEVDLLAEYFPASKGYSWKYRWSRQIWSNGVGPSTSTMPGAPSPTEMLARIAAERALLVYLAEAESWTDGPEEVWLEREVREHAIQIIASGYAARPGYDEGWRP